MIQSFYTGANGLRSQQLNIDVISNNVANIGTTGFKHVRADFKEALYNRMRNPVDNTPKMNLQHGTGVVPMQTNRIFQQGIAMPSDNPLDMMIEGDGFFTIEGVENTEGERVNTYTREGAFFVSVPEEGEEGGGYLVNSEGRFVLDSEGERIQILGDASNLKVDPDGSLIYTSASGEDLDSGIKLGIATFVNPTGLRMTGSNLFMETENSGTAEAMENPKVTNYALEGSNVNYSLEATRLIRAQRAYQFASRVITTADQMAGLANSIRQ